MKIVFDTFYFVCLHTDQTIPNHLVVLLVSLQQVAEGRHSGSGSELFTHDHIMWPEALLLLDTRLEVQGHLQPSTGNRKC